MTVTTTTASTTTATVTSTTIAIGAENTTGAITGAKEKITTVAPSIAQQGATGTAILYAAVVVVLAVLVGAVVVVRARNKHAGGAHPAVRTRFTFASHSCFVLFQFGMEEYSLSFVEKGEGCLLE